MRQAVGSREKTVLAGLAARRADPRERLPAAADPADPLQREARVRSRDRRPRGPLLIRHLDASSLAKRDALEPGSSRVRRCDAASAEGLEVS
jgi:hypothetical protein